MLHTPQVRRACSQFARRSRRKANTPGSRFSRPHQASSAAPELRRLIARERSKFPFSLQLHPTSSYSSTGKYASFARLLQLCRSSTNTAHRCVQFTRAAATAISAKHPLDALLHELRCRTAHTGAQLLHYARFRTQRDISARSSTNASRAGAKSLQLSSPSSAIATPPLSPPLHMQPTRAAPTCTVAAGTQQQAAARSITAARSSSQHHSGSCQPLHTVT